MACHLSQPVAAGLVPVRRGPPEHFVRFAISQDTICSKCACHVAKHGLRLTTAFGSAETFAADGHPRNSALPNCGRDLPSPRRMTLPHEQEARADSAPLPLRFRAP
eukprot:2731094-Amphidinium_carterae.1